MAVLNKIVYYLIYETQRHIFPKARINVET